MLFGLFAVSLPTIIPKRWALSIIVALCLVQFVHVISRVRDPLYNSDAASQFAIQLKYERYISGDALIVNSPSMAFLLSDEPGLNVHQFLQINPKLYFGSNWILLNENPPVEYVITAGSTGIFDVDNAIAQKYLPALVVQKYQLFMKR